MKTRVKPRRDCNVGTSAAPVDAAAAHAAAVACARVVRAPQDVGRWGGTCGSRRWGPLEELGPTAGEGAGADDPGESRRRGEQQSCHVG